MLFTQQRGAPLSGATSRSAGAVSPIARRQLLAVLRGHSEPLRRGPTLPTGRVGHSGRAGAPT
eukprot:3792577-Alexandrium_andersonii.AAC.1